MITILEKNSMPFQMIHIAVFFLSAFPQRFDSAGVTGMLTGD